MLPNTPMMLLSFVNTKLRDDYRDLQELCEDLRLDEEVLKEKMQAIDYEYDPELNKFI